MINIGKLTRNSVCSLDPEVFTWFSSHLDLNLVDLLDMSMLQIKGFLPESKEGKRPLPLLAATAEHGKFVVIVFLLLGVHGVAYLNPKVKEPTDYLLTDLVPNGKLLLNQCCLLPAWTGSCLQGPRMLWVWDTLCWVAAASTQLTKSIELASRPSKQTKS